MAGRLHAQSPVDADRADRRRLAGLLLRAARARGFAAAHARQSAGSHARRRLFHPRARRQERRRHGRSDAAGQRHERHAARPAPGRAGSHHAAAQGDGGDRRGGVRVRRRPPAAPGESRRRTAAERAGRTPAGRATPTRWASRIIWRARRSRPCSALSRRHGALGHQPQHVSRRRPAASAAGGHRSDAPAARRGTEGLAAAGARAGPRAEQFARADQIHRRKPGKSAGPRARAPRIGKRTCAAV